MLAGGALIGRPSTDEFGKSWAEARPLTAVFWVSVLGLFLELLLIRWVSTEIRIFAYLQNTVLVVCFLGLGIGLLTSRRPVVPWHSIAATAALVTLLGLPGTRDWLTGISDRLSVLGDTIIWYEAVSARPLETVRSVAGGLCLTLVVMILLAEAFVPLGRLIGRLLDAHPKPLLAYSVNVAGSLVGTWLFVLLSTLERPPAVWFAGAALLFVPFLLRRRKRPWLETVLLLALGGGTWLAGPSGGLETVWSPYQKLVLRDDRSRVPGYPGERYVVEVNNVGYQQIADLRPETLRASAFPPERIGFTQYDLPFLFHPDPESALLVGAGAGNDAAGALRAGVDSVTAVEIDPAIIAMGRRFHPERPYDSPRVRVVTDDARSFFASAEERYDVIVFGLLDSHTTTAMTNARLDHYVYTREAMARARELLEDDGILFLSFEAQKPFIADRMAGVLRDVFGEEPLAFQMRFHPLSWGGIAFLAGDLESARARLAENLELRQLVVGSPPRFALSYSTPAVTDDWPYLYLPDRQIPLLYFLLAGLLGLVVLYFRTRLADFEPMRLRRWGSEGWHFFFLGAAFLLLEVQNISKAAVVLGNTWDVNAIIISGVLVMVLAANGVVAARPRLRVEPIYGVLLLTVAGLYFVDLARFAYLPYATKAVLVGGLTALPMAFSGIVFARSFTKTVRKDRALGTNLLGAMTGAVLQSISFLGGIRLLLLLVGAFYALALVTRPRVPESEPALGLRRLTGPSGSRRKLATGA